MSQLLVVESSEAWIQRYKAVLGGNCLQVSWARSLDEACYTWRMEGMSVSAVILDENTPSTQGYSGPPSLARQIIADWSVRNTDGVLVLTTGLSEFRRDMPLLADCIYREAKDGAIEALLSKLQ